MVIGAREFEKREDFEDEYNEYSKEYAEFMLSGKSKMTDEDAVNWLKKKEYFEDEDMIEYVKNARIGYRKKLESEHAENIEEKVNQLYPYELICR